MSQLDSRFLHLFCFFHPIASWEQNPTDFLDKSFLWQHKNWDHLDLYTAQAGCGWFPHKNGWFGARWCRIPIASPKREAIASRVAPEEESQTTAPRTINYSNWKVDGTGTVPTYWFYNWPITNLPFGICAICFDLKVTIRSIFFDDKRKQHQLRSRFPQKKKTGRPGNNISGRWWDWSGHRWCATCFEVDQTSQVIWSKSKHVKVVQGDVPTQTKKNELYGPLCFKMAEK